jgi:hypothetical protein
MRVAVRILPEARVQLLKLLTARAADASDALVVAINYCEEVVRVFQTYGAPPPGAVLRPRGERDSWWLFADGIWLAFTREDLYVGPRPFRRLERNFTVVAAAARPTGA